VKLIQGGMQIL